MWVRVEATVRGKTRSLVALLQLETFSITLKTAAAQMTARLVIAPARR